MSGSGFLKTVRAQMKEHLGFTISPLCSRPLSPRSEQCDRQKGALPQTGEPFPLGSGPQPAASGTPQPLSRPGWGFLTQRSLAPVPLERCCWLTTPWDRFCSRHWPQCSQQLYTQPCLFFFSMLIPIDNKSEHTCQALAGSMPLTEIQNVNPFCLAAAVRNTSL